MTHLRLYNEPDILSMSEEDLWRLECLWVALIQSCKAVSLWTSYDMEVSLVEIQECLEGTRMSCLCQKRTCGGWHVLSGVDPVLWSR